MPECTKIAHRRSLAIFTADEGIAGNSAARIIFTHFLRRRNRGSLAIFFAEEIAHLGALKNRAILWGAVKIATAAAENRAILVHSGTVCLESISGTTWGKSKGHPGRPDPVAVLIHRGWTECPHGGHLKPVTLKPVIRIFRIFRVFVPAFSAFSAFF